MCTLIYSIICCSIYSWCSLQDSCSYAIQEILQVYNCATIDVTRCNWYPNVFVYMILCSYSTGYKIWNEIPSELQEVLKPHFNSRLVQWTIPHTYYNLGCYIFYF